MKYFLSIIVLFVCVAVQGNITNNQAAIVEPKTIVVLGDSLSAGYNMRRNQTWVALLQQRLAKIKPSWQVVNASVAGATSDNVMAALPRVLKEQQPDILILQIGGNDGLRGLSVKKLEMNIAAMIAYARMQNSKILLVGVRMPPNYGPEYTEAFNQLYQRLANNWHVALVPQLLKDVGGNPKLMQADGIHPKIEAQTQLLQNIWPTLEKLLNEKNKLNP